MDISENRSLPISNNFSALDDDDDESVPETQDQTLPEENDLNNGEDQVVVSESQLQLVKGAGIIQQRWEEMVGQEKANSLYLVLNEKKRGEGGSQHLSRIRNLSHLHLLIKIPLRHQQTTMMVNPWQECFLYQE